MATHEDHNILQPWASLDITKFSVALGVFGFYLVTIGQLSYLIKARLLMSSALLALCVGIGASLLPLSHCPPGQGRRPGPSPSLLSYDDLTLIPLSSRRSQPSVPSGSTGSRHGNGRRSTRRSGAT